MEEGRSSSSQHRGLRENLKGDFLFHYLFCERESELREANWRQRASSATVQTKPEKKNSPAGALAALGMDVLAVWPGGLIATSLVGWGNSLCWFSDCPTPLAPPCPSPEPSVVTPFILCCCYDLGHLQSIWFYAQGFVTAGGERLN